MKRSRMFHLGEEVPIRRSSPVAGCGHHCYKDNCWAARTARRLKNLERYKDGFDHPKLIEHELLRRFNKGIVFLCSMGDLFCDAVPDEWINKVITMMWRSPKATFFLETKNPARYHRFIELLPINTILSTTIESDIDYGSSLAPPPSVRFMAMKRLKELCPMKLHISIEPIMDFSPLLLQWMKDLQPWAVSVGYDNYKCGLTEPPLEKTLALISDFEALGIIVERKTLREAHDRPSS